MRLYLDTNVLVALLTKQDDKLDNDTLELVTDYSNVLYTSIVCIHELIHLRKIGKVNVSKDWNKKTDVVQRLSEFDIRMSPITAKHLQMEEQLPLIGKHRDPNDRLIIAQAISDKATLISSDSQFPLYEEYGLKFHRNEP